jgi:general secretion pathway protein A
VGVARGYEPYFGLVESPFGLTPNRRFLFESESHSAAVEQLTLAIRRREPLIVLTGEIGTGKTLLCRTIQAVEPRTFVSVISNPKISSLDLLRQVLYDFGLTPDAPAGAGETTEHETDRIFQLFLSSLASLSAHAVIVIDEAQRLEPETFEQVRQLCSLEGGAQELLQVILIGRLELNAMLEQPELRRLAECVSRRHELRALKPYEVAQYTEHRLSIARGDSARTNSNDVGGERSPSVRFTPVALRALAAVTRGLPRAVNVICDGALAMAHAEHKRVVDAGCVLAAARNLKVVVPFKLHLRSRRRREVVTSLVVAACVGLIALRATGVFTWPAPVTQPLAALPREAAASLIVEEPATVAQLPEAASYSVAAASFRTEARAAELANSLRLLDLPVFVRLVEGSHAVVVGPFASREEAVEAQAQIARAHVTNSRIVSTAPSHGASVHSLRPVATTGQ